MNLVTRAENVLRHFGAPKTSLVTEVCTGFEQFTHAQKGTILFVGTKRTSRDAIVAEAKRAGMPYVDQRWLGGMLRDDISLIPLGFNSNSLTFSEWK